MEMRTEVVVLEARHYQMDTGQQGLNLRIAGKKGSSNNGIGMEVAEAAVPDYSEIHKFTSLAATDYPAVFEGTIEFTRVKDKGGKEKAGVTLSNLVYKHSLDLVPRKK